MAYTWCINAFPPEVQINDKKCYMEEEYAIIISPIDNRDTELLIKHIFFQISGLKSLFEDNESAHAKISALLKRAHMIFQEFKIIGHNQEFQINLNDVKARHKRGLFNGIGEGMHFLFGVASPSEYERLVKFRHHSQELQKRQLIVNSKFKIALEKEKQALELNTQIIKNLTSEVEKIELKVFELDILQGFVIQMESAMQNIERQILVLHLTEIEAKNNHLNIMAIERETLKAALSKILMDNKGLSLPFGLERLDMYYDAKMTTVHRTQYGMVVALRIPLINKGKSLSIRLIKPTEIKTLEEPHYKLEYENGNLRYLTQRDYDQCIETENRDLICPKRHLEIKNAESFAYDISHTNIIVHSSQNTNGKIICPDTTDKQIIIPDFGLIKIPLACTLHSANYFIGQVSYYNTTIETKVEVIRLNFTDFSRNGKLKEELARKWVKTHHLVNESQNILLGMDNDLKQAEAELNETISAYEREIRDMHKHVHTNYGLSAGTMTTILIAAVALFLYCKCTNKGGSSTNKTVIDISATTQQSLDTREEYSVEDAIEKIDIIEERLNQRIREAIEQSNQEIMLHIESKYHANNKQLENWFNQLGLPTLPTTNTKVEFLAKEIDDLRMELVDKDMMNEIRKLDQLIQDINEKIENLKLECSRAYTSKSEMRELQTDTVSTMTALTEKMAKDKKEISESIKVINGLLMLKTENRSDSQEDPPTNPRQTVEDLLSPPPATQ